MDDEKQEQLLSAPVGVAALDLGASKLARVIDEKPEALRLCRSRLPAELSTRLCPQCGLNPAGPLKSRSFEFVPPWVYVGLAVNIVVLFALYMVGRKRIALAVGLCPDCAKAERRGRLLRRVSISAAVAAPFAAILAGLVANSELVAFGGAGVALVGGVLGSIVTFRRTRSDVVDCVRIDKESLVLRASPSWGRVLKEERPELLES